MTSVANILACELAHAGVEVVFGLPGGETVELLDELRKQGIDFVLVRNESSAFFMADSYARATGRPAVCMTTLGPGAANATMGIAHCYLDRSPVVAITAQKPASLLPGYTHQVIDLQALYQPICKASIRVDASNARRVVHDAFSLAAAGRPGPVHLQLSSEDALAKVDGDGADADRIAPSTFEVPQIGADQLEMARAAMSRSRRPLLLAGLGLEPQRPYAALRALAESHQAPVIVTPKAKGAIADDHPLYAGTVGLTNNDPVYEIVAEADCIIAVGFDVVELVKPWTSDVPLIWIAAWGNTDPKLPSVCELNGDMTFALTSLASVTREADDNWGEIRVAGLRTRQQDSPPEPHPGFLSPQTMLGALRAHADSADFLAVDVGSHKIFSSLAWQALEPNRFLVSNGLSSMSYALPAAIGAAIACPKTHAFCLTGDAGFAMNMGELGVLRERNLPVLVVVLNDGAIDLIRSHQQRAGKRIFGTEFAPPDHAQIGAAFGLSAHRVSSENELAGRLVEFKASAAPALIEVMLDPAGYPTTPKAHR